MVVMPEGAGWLSWQRVPNDRHGRGYLMAVMAEGTYLIVVMAEGTYLMAP